MKNHQRSPGIFTRKSSLVATQIALALMAQVAYAQQATPERVERVEITGTRLPALNVEGPSPVTVMEAQEIRMDGLAKTEDLLNNLPQVFAGQGSAVSNGSTGTANVSLRNLGPTRNLVLFNGRRLPAGSPQSGAQSAAADLNQIPAPLIQRVELLTGGASAVYGSDAITGVVNFIMNDRFEGLQFDINHSFYNHQQQNPDGIADLVRAKSLLNPSQFQVPSDVNDGKINALSMLMGRNFADNKGNATLFISYKKEDPVLQKARDFSACALNPGNASGTLGFSCGGSSTSFPGRFIGGLGAADPGFDLTVRDAAGNTRAFDGATDQFNYGPYNYYRRPAEQYAANAFAHLDINPKVRAYTELGYHDNHTEGQVAPGGIFLGDVYTIHADNPLLSADWRNQIAAGQVAPFVGPADTADMLIGRRNIEGGGRVQDMRHTSFRWVGGAKGALNKTWNYDVFLQTGQVQMQRVDKNYFSTVKIRRALDVVAGPGGVPTCRSVIDGTDPTCVPYDLWSLGHITPAALNYISAQGLQQGTTKQHVFSASVEADLGNYGLKLPTARDGVAFAFGVERRKEALSLVTDQEEATGDLSGSGGAAIGVEGALNSDEWFTEARVPLAQRVPFADLLSVNGSYRRSDYSTGKKTNTYGVGAEWAPVRAYRARASYQHAIRHANIQELFQPQGNNLFGMTSDPCGPSMSATLAQCARTGITPAQYGSAIIDSPAGQYNFTQGGNPALNPEIANTYTLGLVMNPVRNLTATIDWWDIKIEDAIGAAPPSTLLSQCLTAGSFCDQIHRDALGTLWAINNGAVTATNLNLGSYRTTGIDLAASYTWRMGANGFGVHFNGSYMDKWEFEPIKGAGKFDCAGYFGPQCGTPNPQWRHKIRGTWQSPWNVDLALTWRHIDEVKHEGLNDSPLLRDPTVPKTDAKLDSRDYFDVAAQWNVNKTVTLRAGVNNVMDTDPPIISGVTADPAIFGNGNTFPQIYDTLGRLVFMNLTLKF